MLCVEGLIDNQQVTQMFDRIAAQIRRDAMRQDGLRTAAPTDPAPQWPAGYFERFRDIALQPRSGVPKPHDALPPARRSKLPPSAAMAPRSMPNLEAWYAGHCESVNGDSGTAECTPHGLFLKLHTSPVLNRQDAKNAEFPRPRLPASIPSYKTAEEWSLRKAVTEASYRVGPALRRRPQTNRMLVRRIRRPQSGTPYPAGFLWGGMICRDLHMIQPCRAVVCH